jgi:hypothetical protein
MSDLVLFIFAGRKANMEVQKPYLDRILTDHPEAELHLWDLTRTATDGAYVRSLHGQHDGRVHVMTEFHSGHPIKCLYPNGRPRRRGWPPCTCMLHKPPYEEPYKFYAKNWVGPDGGEASTVFVKMDDDVLFLETDRFDDLIRPLVDHPNRVISANTINNAVAAKYQPHALLTANQFAVGDPANWANDKRWWALHIDPKFARWEHDQFLTDTIAATGLYPTSYVRTRPGEAISINCVAFTHSTMRRLATWFNHDPRLGDEGAIDRMLPWICTSFHAAHLTFGPQDQAMTEDELQELRDRYMMMRKGYLGE